MVVMEMPPKMIHAHLGIHIMDLHVELIVSILLLSFCYLVSVSAAKDVC